MNDALARLRSALADRYTIEREIGAGGMATVYLAHDLKHDRNVAVKVFRPELAAALGTERFFREIKITANLNHPHILALLDSGEADGFLYYVMPLAEGDSLRERLNREKQLTVDAALKITSQVASALSYAHSRDIVHRDIKPENILFQASEVVVADFGIALAVDSAGGTRLTETGFSLGTPSYMSPEQVAGDREIDGRSDTYSLACVLYEMLAGDPPFIASNPRAVLAKHLTDPAPPITTVRSSVPLPVAAAINKALGKVPADRFESAIAFSEALLATEVATEEEKQSIVVLPFENLSPDPDNAFFADGLTEELIADLSKMRALRVISRTSAMMYKDAKKSAPAIAQELNVRYVVEGSVRRAGNNLRITVQLIDGSTDAHLWAEKYSGTLDDVFDLQEQLSRRIVDGLRLSLTPDEYRELAARPIRDVRAYDLFWRARSFAGAQTEQSLRNAIDLYQSALAVDPTYALAYAGIATAWGWLGDMYLAPAEVAPKVRDAALRALELDSSIAEAHSMMGFLHATHDYNFTSAEGEFRTALALDPTSVDAGAIFANFASTIPRLQAEALALTERLMAMDPISPLLSWQRAICLYLMRRYDEAVAEYGHLRAIQSDFFYADAFDGAALRETGHLDSALAAYRRAELHNPGRPLHGLAVTLARMGHPAEARDVLESLEAYAREHYVSPVSFAMVHGALGDFDAAFAAFDRAVAAHDAWLWGIPTWPELDPVRNDRRFAALQRRVFGDYVTG